MGIGYDLFYKDFIENSICHKNNVQKVYCSNIIRLIPEGWLSIWGEST